MKNARILVVEDEVLVSTAISFGLESMGYQVVCTVNSGEEAIRAAAELLPDLILMDIHLDGEMNGIEAADRIHQEYGLPIIYLTSYDDDDTLAKASITEPFGYVLKPYSESDLHSAIEIGLYKHKIEKRLRASEAKYRTLVENLEHRIFHKNRDFIYVACNQNFARDLRLTPDDIVGKTDYDFYPEEAADAHRHEDQQVLDTGRPVQSEKDYQYNGDTRTMQIVKTPLKDDDGRITGILGIFWDISEQKRAEVERRKLEVRLRQTQRLEALGTLAGGIAHDFNNILGTILGYTELLQTAENPAAIMQEYLAQIYQAGERATGLVQQILTFSRSQERPALTPMDLAPLIKETLTMIRATTPATIEIRPTIAPGCRPILADPTQMHQVLVNLCTNACYAMKEQGGVLELKVEETYLKPNAGHILDMPEGSYLELVVSDTGCGIPPESQEHIFEPFFTTKAVGEGTGLGLSVVHGIVKGCGGEIVVDSQVGGGTAFHLYFPVTDKPIGRPLPSRPEPLPAGKESILLVDDEPGLTRLYRVALTTLGYRVTVAHNGEHALALFHDDPQRYDLVFTDQNMPHLTGVQLSQEILKIRADIPIILTTGYSDLVSEDEALALGIRQFLMKPVKIRTLLQAIRQALGETTAD